MVKVFDNMTGCWLPEAASEADALRATTSECVSIYRNGASCRAWGLEDGRWVSVVQWDPQDVYQITLAEDGFAAHVSSEDTVVFPTAEAAEQHVRARIAAFEEEY